MGYVNDLGVKTGDVFQQITGEAASDAAKDAARSQSDAQRTNVQESARQFDVTQASLQPFQDAGVSALGQQQALLGLSGEDEQQQAFQAFNESPGQKFLRDRGERATIRNAGAIGGLGGGNVRKALTEFGIGTAQQDFQNQFGRLGQLAGQGQGAATSIGQFGSNAAGQQSGFRTAGSEALASGILGSQQAKAQGVEDTMQFVTQIAGAFSDSRLKTDIQEMDRDKFGGVYSFRYIDDEQLYIGRIAQELLETRPDAVSVHESGYYQVTEEFKPEKLTCH